MTQKPDNRSEPGAETAEPSPDESKNKSPENKVNDMYRDAAKDLADKGAADPKKAKELAEKASKDD